MVRPMAWSGRYQSARARGGFDGGEYARGVSRQIEPKRAWEQVVDWVEERILSGELVVGSQLPSERDLATRLAVGRSAVREAVRTLQAFGVVRSAVGAGGTGGTTITGVPHRALSRMLRLHVALSSFPTADVTQVRIVLERLSAELASRHASEQDLQQMTETVASMDDDALTMEEFNDLDAAFHVSLAQAAGNRLAGDLTVAIRESMRGPILLGLTALADWPATRARLRRDHHAVLDAVRQRRGAEAADLVAQHIRTAYEGMPSLHHR